MVSPGRTNLNLAEFVLDKGYGAHGLKSCLYLCNMDSLRDWGHGKIARACYSMTLQQEVTDDFGITTGKQTGCAV